MTHFATSIVNTPHTHDPQSLHKLVLMFVYLLFICDAEDGAQGPSASPTAKLVLYQETSLSLGFAHLWNIASMF